MTEIVLNVPVASNLISMLFGIFAILATFRIVLNIIKSLPFV